MISYDGAHLDNLTPSMRCVPIILSVFHTAYFFSGNILSIIQVHNVTRYNFITLLFCFYSSLIIHQVHVRKHLFDDLLPEKYCCQPIKFKRINMNHFSYSTTIIITSVYYKT